MSSIVKADCSGCMEPFKINTGTGKVTMVVPSNGKRGSLHVPAHTVTAEADLDRSETLLLWDCPRCGYAESVYADEEVRRAMT